MDECIAKGFSAKLLEHGLDVKPSAERHYLSQELRGMIQGGLWRFPPDKPARDVMDFIAETALLRATDAHNVLIISVFPQPSKRPYCIG